MASKKLADATDDELEAEMARRRNLPAPPPPMVNAELPAATLLLLRDYAESVVEAYAARDRTRPKDIEQYMYEAIMQGFYGPKVFDWINRRTNGG